ncbi:S-adenosyl-L-methionine-dependent methyltransferase [Truncatella angustata]|uniref:S-adenosyl-L-methionine-dependent methyltransferase n=1 Tax=Truncatella angustata TaxID=152316 RepID=A0A9P8UJ83_9PEZI|nr:S-adenosyl-L-methionine-dependent methyltransferase [Truncatella angustata]KAH6653121.1 S-adenosyl-L-methionine-dependent methyltransferase [Truncatella angustata]
MAGQTNGTAKAPLILALAQDILKKTQEVTSYLQANNIQTPTFQLQSSATPETVEYQELYEGLKTSLEDLEQLIDGPKKFWRQFCCLPYDLGGLQTALDFGFFNSVPSNKPIPLKTLAENVGLDEDRVSRVVRQLITYRIFQEPEAGLVSHSPNSLIMSQDEDFRSMVHYSADEMFKAAADCGDCFRANPSKADSEHNPFVTHHGVGIFGYYAKYPDKAERFAKAMAGWRKMDAHLDNLLRDGFDWARLHGTVVDVGGGNGHVSRSFASQLPHLKFIVQDSNIDMLNQGKQRLTDEIRDRVSFVQHSFFDPQPEKNAAVFLIRQCTHNWADRDVVKILKSLVPGLENSGPDTPLLINDIVLPELGKWPRHRERLARQVDMIMLVNCGAKQRTRAEFETLLKEADPRFEIHNVLDNGPLGLLEVYLKRC